MSNNTNALQASEQPSWQDFGYANGWRDGAPEPVRKAWNDKEAQWTVRRIGRCCEEYRCEKHGVIYRVDSSD